jgi:hypothetical protein
MQIIKSQGLSSNLLLVFITRGQTYVQIYLAGRFCMKVLFYGAHGRPFCVLCLVFSMLSHLVIVNGRERGAVLCCASIIPPVD